MPLRSLHRFSALVLAVFVSVHATNHLVSAFGIEHHIRFMEAARLVYRAPVVEAVLLFCVAFQVLSGLRLAVRSWRQRIGFVPWLRALTGFYLAFFLIVHVSAVLFGRGMLDLDTNFYFAAAGIHVPPYEFFFVPYYFLSLVALFAHLGGAMYWHSQTSNQRVRWGVIFVPVLLGSAISAIVVLSLAGKLQPVEIPTKYKATYADNAA